MLLFLVEMKNPPLDFSLDLYLLFKAHVNNYRILEYEVNFGKRLYGESKGGGTLIGKLKLIKRTFKYIVKLKKELGR